MKGLLLAGGHGTRLRPLTYTGNKHMIPIANRPMLFYGLDNMKKAGIKDVGIILGPLGESIKEVVGTGSSWGLNVTYIPQPEPKGIAHAIVAARNFLGDDTFLFHLGDILLNEGIPTLVDKFYASKCNCLIATYRVKEPQRCGTVEYENGKIVKLTEKPENPKTDLILAGVCILDNSIHEAVSKTQPSRRNELELCDAIQVLVDSGRDVRGQMLGGWWKDTGRPEDLLEANQLILQGQESKIEGTIESGSTHNGTIRIGSGSRVFGGTSLRGPVIIGENCVIGPNSYIGPHTAIGDNVTVRESEIENSIVMHSTMMNSKGRIANSLIGAHSEIVSNGKPPNGHKVIIGERCRVEW